MKLKEPPILNNPLNAKLIAMPCLSLCVHPQCNARHIFRYVRKATAVTLWGFTMSFLTSAFSVAFSDKTSDSVQKCLAVLGALTLNAALSVHRNFVWNESRACYVCKYFHQTVGYKQYNLLFDLVLLLLFLFNVEKYNLCSHTDNYQLLVDTVHLDYEDFLRQ